MDEHFTNSDLPTIEDIIEARRKTHGNFSDSARITQGIKLILRDSPNWNSLPSYMRESFEMQAQKWGRILAGDPFIPDHWRDCGGYVQLVVERLPGGRDD